MKYLVLSLTFGFALVSGGASADIIQNPTAGTAEAALLDGLKLVKNGKFDDWVSKYCSKEKACATSDSIMSYKRFNLTMMQRRAPACLRENDTALDINKILDEGDGSKTIYLRCEATTIPVPFNLIKEGDSWRFSKI
jgi:hypothetical protein